MSRPTYPSYMDNDLYSVEADLVELRRHVSHLLDDLAFCTEHNVIRAIEHFDERVQATCENAGRRGAWGLHRARRMARQHPGGMLLALGAMGFALGWLAFRGTNTRPANSRRLFSRLDPCVEK